MKLSFDASPEEIAAYYSANLQEVKRLVAIVESEPPVLVGSAAQVKWASDIRGKHIAVARELLVASLFNKNGLRSRYDEPEVTKIAKMAEDHVRTDAGWWIANRRSLLGQR